MAADESLLEIDDDRILRGFIKLQGHIRGILMRKALLEIQKDYEEIVADIEGDMTVHWPSNTLGLPALRKRHCSQNHGASQNKNTKSGWKNKETPHHLTKQEQRSGSRDEHFSSILPLPSDQHHPLQINSKMVSCNSERADSFQVTETDVRNNDCSSNCSPRIVSKCKTPVESTSCQADISTWSNKNAMGHMKPSNHCVSKEVQTDVIVEEINDQTEPERLEDSVLTQHSHVNSDAILPKPSGMPSMSPDWERTNAKGEKHDDSQFQCSSNNELVCLPVSMLSSNEMEPGVKDIVPKAVIKGVTVSAESEIESKDQLVVDFDEAESPTDIVRCSEDLSDHARKPVSGESKAESEIGADVGVDTDTDVSPLDLPKDKAELLKLKGTLAMELLWIEQAINSRKNYLRLKHQLS